MKVKIITALVGRHPSYPTGVERIHTLLDAIKWRLGSLPGLDASVGQSGRVTLFCRRG